jgi:hypothetical protein
MKAVDVLMKRLSENKIEDAEKLLIDLGHRHIKYGAKTEYVPVRIFIFMILNANIFKLWI